MPFLLPEKPRGVLMLPNERKSPVIGSAPFESQHLKMTTQSRVIFKAGWNRLGPCDF